MADLFPKPFQNANLLRAIVSPAIQKARPVTTYLALDLDLFPRRIAVEPCAAPCLERTCSAIAILEKLDVGNLVPPSNRAKRLNGDVISFRVTFDL